MSALARGRRVVYGVAAGAALMTAGGLLSTAFVKSPAQLAAETGPPAQGVLTAEVERRVLAETVVMRGTVVAGQSVAVAPQGEGRPVVTRLPFAAGAPVTAGRVVAEVSGRPVVALRGALPVYRDLRPGATGDDVAQLQAALRELGHPTGRDPRGHFGPGTKDALAALYRDLGYPPLPAVPDGADRVRSARTALREAAWALEDAEAEAVAAKRGAAVPPGGTDGVRAPSPTAARLGAVRHGRGVAETGGRAAGEPYPGKALACAALRLAAAVVGGTEGAAYPGAGRPDGETRAGIRPDSLGQPEGDGSAGEGRVDGGGGDGGGGAGAGVPAAGRAVPAPRGAGGGAGAPTGARDLAATGTPGSGTPGTGTRAPARPEADDRAAGQPYPREAPAGTAARAFGTPSPGLSAPGGHLPPRGTPGREEMPATAQGEPAAAPTPAPKPGATPPPGSTLPGRELARARVALAEARAELAAAEAADGPMLPAAEVVFLRAFPARVSGVGATVGAPVTGTLLTLTAGELLVEAYLKDDKHRLLRPGLPVLVSSELTGTEVPGKVTLVAADRSTGTPPGAQAPVGEGQLPAPAVDLGYRMLVRPDRPLPAALTGQDVRLTVEAATTGGPALVVPVTAVSSGADGLTSVTTVNRAGTRHRIEVRTGTTGDGYVEIEPVAPATLQPGAQVITGTAAPGAGAGAGTGTGTGTGTGAGTGTDAGAPPS
ncbi:peptidoglycan-binding protein [Streptomyces sp. NPDC101118]|uniref:peptidoglycan-binding protein n=1 Tax=Streptomyces sp. NPDC101118 TaxID=3366109 RepID=UPI00381870D9